MEAHKYDLNYIGLSGNIGCMVNGAGYVRCCARFSLPLLILFPCFSVVFFLVFWGVGGCVYG